MNATPETPAAAPAPKGKKSVALSGVPAGNTALCSVGRTGNDLHYRGYDILEVAESCDFEEIAYLLIHGRLPNRAQLAAYKLGAWGNPPAGRVRMTSGGSDRYPAGRPAVLNRISGPRDTGFPP